MKFSCFVVIGPIMTIYKKDLILINDEINVNENNGH